MSLRLWIVLQWTCMCMCLYGRMIYFLLVIWVIMELLDQMVVLFSILWKIPTLLSTRPALYILTSSVWAFPFLCNLTSICYFLISFFFFWEVVSLLLLRLECNATISPHYVRLPGLSDSSVSASLVAGITGLSHCARPTVALMSHLRLACQHVNLKKIYIFIYIFFHAHTHTYTHTHTMYMCMSIYVYFRCPELDYL